MNTHLHRNSVLVLNRAWQAINQRTPIEAVAMVSAGAATVLDITVGLDGEVLGMTPVKWDDWLKLPVRETDDFIATVRGKVRLPTVIIAVNYSKVPKKRPRFSPRAIRERDNNTCQYTGRKLALGESNIDHVVARSRGGATNWENCVLAAKDVNSRKADKSLEESGLKLRSVPKAPGAVPVSETIFNRHNVPDWNFFLNKK